MDTLPWDLVQYSCNKCRNNPNFCVGTLILPNLAITSTFCSTSCQYITRRGRTFTIYKRFTSNNSYHNQKNGSVIQTSSEISLTQFETHISSSIVKFGELKSINRTVPLVQYPVLVTNQQPQLRSALLQLCVRPKNLQVSGNYICTSKNLSDAHSCQQGIPLLYNDQILGITVSSTCQLHQTIFMATGPSLSWIEPVLESVKSIKGKEYLRVSTNWSSTTLCTRSVNATDAPTELNSTDDIEHDFNIASEEYINHLNSLKNTTRLFKGSLVIGLRTTTQEEKLTDTSTVAVATTGETTVAMDKDSSTTSTTSIMETSPDGLSNAMQWFKSVKSQLKTGTSPILVLTTSKPITTMMTAEFLDLT